MPDTRGILRQFCTDCCSYLNAQSIETKIGKYRLELSSRTLSDIVEKRTIDYMIDYFGEDKVSFGNWRGYDVVIITLEETLYVNVKTNEQNPKLDATWLCSASVIDHLRKQAILDHLYCVKFEYVKEGRDALAFVSGKVAGPVSDINLIDHTKGQPSQYRLRTEFNGTHCHILESDYE